MLCMAGPYAPGQKYFFPLATLMAGLLLAAEPFATRLLARESRHRLISRLNKTVMTVYLWHMAPTILVAAAFYPTGIAPQPPIGTLRWWQLRAVWWVILAVILAPLTWTVMRLERPLLRLPAGLGRSGPWSPVLLTAGTAPLAVSPARPRLPRRSP